MSTKNLKSWNEFLELELTQTEKLELLRSSNLSLTNPGNKRSRVWIELVNREYGISVYNFFKEATSKGQVKLAPETVQEIKASVQRLSGPFSELHGIQQKLTTLLSLFCFRRPDIGCQEGMNYIAGVLFSVFSMESDVFIVFCHIIENVFPERFFSTEDRGLVMHRELRVLSRMAEQIRPDLVKSLQAIFKPSGSNLREKDITPFVWTVKRIGETWFRTLFASFLVSSDSLRVWDNILVYGFEFVQKFALALLSRNEKFLRNNIKQETKALGIGPSVDALIVSGNFSKQRLFRKIEKLPVERLIKKSVSKKKYKALVYRSYFEEAEQLERDVNQRVQRLRQTKALLQKKNPPFRYEEAESLIGVLETVASEGKVSRAMFVLTTTKEFVWPKELAVNFFTTFDQLGDDYVDLLDLKIGLAVLIPENVNQKFQLCFEVLDNLKSGSLGSDEAFRIFISIERALDIRSKYLKENPEGFYENVSLTNQQVTQETFVSFGVSDPWCSQLVQFIKCLDSRGSELPPDFRMVDLALDGSYSNIHSQVEAETSNVSSEEEPRILLQRAVPKSDILVSQTPFVEIGILNSDTNGKNYLGVNITNNFEEGRIRFNIHIGEVESEEECHEVVKIPSEKFQDLESEEFQKELQKELQKEPQKEPQKELQELQEDSQKVHYIEFPEYHKDPKRGTCSRLCSKQTCLLY